MEITLWHRLAYLFRTGQITLSEIVQFMLVAAAVGIVEKIDSNQPNLFGASMLNDALVLGLLLHHPPDQFLTYRELGKMLGKHSQTVGGAVNRLIARGIVINEDHGSIGALYYVQLDMLHKFPIPVWVMVFTEAITELNDGELFELVRDEMGDLAYSDGLAGMRAAMARKYHPRMV